MYIRVACDACDIYKVWAERLDRLMLSYKLNYYTVLFVRGNKIATQGLLNVDEQRLTKNLQSLA